MEIFQRKRVQPEQLLNPYERLRGEIIRIYGHERPYFTYI